MNPRKTLQFVLSFIALAVLLAACSPGEIENQPVQIVATPNGDIQLVQVFATHNPLLLDGGTPPPNIFPAGIDKVYLGLKFVSPGTEASRFAVDYQLSYKGLPLETEFDSQPTSWTEQASGVEVVVLPVRRKDGQALGDGPYQAKIFIDGQLIALLNFSLSNAVTPAPPQATPTQGG